MIIMGWPEMKKKLLIIFAIGICAVASFVYLKNNNEKEKTVE